MPKTPYISPECIYNTLKNFVFIHDDQYLPWENCVWQQASDAFGGVMSKKYIWSYIRENRNGVSKRLHPNGIPDIKTAKKKTTDPNWSMPFSNPQLEPIKKTIHLSRKDWDDLGLHKKKFNDGRVYNVLEEGWTDRLYVNIWQHLGLPCAFTFKKNQINTTPGETFLTIHGNCRECDTGINIYSLTEPTTDGIVLQISTLDTRKIIHLKKRQLRGKSRNNVLEKLKGKSTYLWRAENADKLMTFGNVEPAHLYNSNVLRQAKYENNLKQHGIRPATDPVMALLKLKNNSKFCGSIREISCSKFYCMFWLPEQISMYNLFLKEDITGSISIDATGSLLRPIRRLDGSRSVTFLYQAVADYKGNTLPIFQMISEKHDANTLCYWMREWLRSGAKRPKQVVVDDSSALLNAISLAFNEINLSEYQNRCYLQATKRKYKSRMCLVRLDIAHLIKAVAGWACFSKRVPHIKDFFLRSVAILIRSTSIEDFEKKLLAILVVASTEFIENNGNNTCKKYVDYLLNLMKNPLDLPQLPDNEVFVDFSILEENNDVEHDELKLLDQKSPIENFLNSVTTKLNICNAGNVRNKYYCADFAPRLLKLSKRFLLWTAIMPVLYNGHGENSMQHVLTASSARSEAFFKDIKKLIFLNQKSINIVIVVTTLLTSLSGCMKLAAANKNLQSSANKENHFIDSSCEISDVSNISSLSFLQTSTPENNGAKVMKIVEKTPEKEEHLIIDLVSDSCSSTDESISSTDSLIIEKAQFSDHKKLKHSNRKNSSEVLNFSHLDHVDEWGGLLKKKEKRGTYLTPLLDIENIHKRPKLLLKTELLINGNSLPPIHTNKGFIKIMNTCAFDAIVHCIRAGYINWAKYNNYINNNNNCKLYDIVKILSSKGAGKDVYDIRATLLLQTKHINILKNNILDCTTNVANLIDQLLYNEPSVIEEITCEVCGNYEKRTRITLAINLKPLHEHGLQGIEQSLKEYLALTSNCKCGGKKIKIVNVQNHLILDIEALGSKSIAGHLESHQMNFSLNEVPYEVSFASSNYKLAALITRMQFEDVGHYECYVRKMCIKSNWQLHDGKTPTSRIQNLTAKQVQNQHSIHVVFYVKD